MFNLSEGSAKWLFLRGFSKVMVIIMFYYSLTVLNLRTTMTLYNTIPIWALVFDECVFAEMTVLPIHFFITIIVTVGIVLLSQPSFLFDSHYLENSSEPASAGEPRSVTTFEMIVGYALSLGSAVFECIAFISQRKIALLERIVNDNGDVDYSNSGSVIICGVYSVSVQLLLMGFFGSYTFYQEFLVNKDFMTDNMITYLLGAGFLSFLSIYTMNDGVSRITIIQVSLLVICQLIWVYVFETLWLSNNIFNKNKYSPWMEIVGIGLIVVPTAILCLYTMYCILRNSRRDAHRSGFRIASRADLTVVFPFAALGRIFGGFGDTSISLQESNISGDAMESQTSVCFSNECEMDE